MQLRSVRYKRGDIVVVPFPFADKSKSKKRPALIISNTRVNRTGDYLMVQITSVQKSDGLSIKINRDDFSSNELLLKSYVRLHKIFLLNETLILKKATAVKLTFLTKLISKINEIIN